MRSKTVGRPKKITGDMLRQLRQAYMIGATDDEACLFVGISPSTLYKFQEKNKQFLEQKALWKTSPTFRAKATIVQNLDKVDVAKWYLERKSKAEFALRSGVSDEQSSSNIEVIFLRK